MLFLDKSNKKKRLTQLTLQLNCKISNENKKNNLRKQWQNEISVNDHIYSLSVIWAFKLVEVTIKKCRGVKSGDLAGHAITSAHLL